LFKKKGADKCIIIWNPIDGTREMTMKGHSAGISDIAWSPDSHYIASASDDTTLKIWDANTVSKEKKNQKGFCLMISFLKGRECKNFNWPQSLRLLCEFQSQF
jgi:WD40 repeat protein